MTPTLFPGDRLLLLRYWPAKWLRQGQIIMGDFSKGVDYWLRSSLSAHRSHNITTEDLTPVGPHEHDTDFLNMGSGFDLETPSESTATHFVKRIIGLPGDEVRIHISSIHPMLQPHVSVEPDPDGYLVWHVPAEHCFVRGDGSFSGDSIMWGPIPLQLVKGLVLTKLSGRGTYQPNSSWGDKLNNIKEVMPDKQVSRESSISLEIEQNSHKNSTRWIKC